MKTLLRSVFCFLGLLAQPAIAGLLVLPDHVVFNERSRVQEVMVANVTDKPVRYDIGWVNQRQTENGGYVMVKDDESFARASEYLRFSPRRVTLQPGESQKIKLLLRRKNNMVETEYRSHLKFEAVPLQQQNQNSTGEGISFALNLMLSYTIPVLVQTTQGEVDITISEPQVVIRDAQPVVQFKLNRKGDISAKGDLKVERLNQETGEYVSVGFLNGIRVFTENGFIQTEVALLPGQVPQRGDQFRILFNGKEPKTVQAATDFIF